MKRPKESLPTQLISVNCLPRARPAKNLFTKDRVVVTSQTDHVNSVASLEERKTHFAVIAKYLELFKEELGLLKGTSAELSLKPNATPRFYKPRPVPYAYKAKVEAKLKRLRVESTIEPVTFSE